MGPAMPDTKSLEVGAKLPAADQAIYHHWVEVLAWCEEITREREGQLVLSRESDLLAFISHMERSYYLPTHVQAVSLRRKDGRGRKLFAAVSRPGGLDRKIEIRDGRVRQVLEARDGRLVMKGQPYERERFRRTCRQAGLI